MTEGNKMGPARIKQQVPGPPHYATRGNLFAMAGVTARQKGESLAVTEAYDRFALMEA